MVKVLLKKTSFKS